MDIPQSPEQSSAVLENRASLCDAASTEVFCPSCDEALVFAMRDNHHDFSIGLGTILECLVLAEKHGHVPALPDQWWVQIGRRYDRVEKLHHTLFYQEE